MRALFLILLSTVPLPAGQHLRFELPVGPGGRAATAHAYVFNSRDEVLRVVDQGAGPVRPYADLGAACLATKATAGINGGGFDPQGEPAGMILAGGKKAGTPASGGPASGGVIWGDGKNVGLSRSEGFDFTASPATDLVQAGPFVVENGKAATGLDASSFARRTLVLTDGAELWALLFVPSATLDGLAKTLATPEWFSPFRPMQALNLDGGASSGLWIRRDNGQLFYLREISKVRNFIVVVPRKQG